MLFATKRRSSASSPSPNFCATGMTKPLQMPMQKPSTRKLTELVEPTPASASMPRKRPTTSVSTILYSCWNSRPPSSGSRKPMTSRVGEPVVRFRDAVFAIRVPPESIEISISKNVCIVFSDRKKYNPQPSDFFAQFGAGIRQNVQKQDFFQKNGRMGGKIGQKKPGFREAGRKNQGIFQRNALTRKKKCGKINTQCCEVRRRPTSTSWSDYTTDRAARQGTKMKKQQLTHACHC